MQNNDADGIAHYPGWSTEVLSCLYEERKITASGHETTDTDPGVATSKGDYSLETYILGSDHYQIELLTNLAEGFWYDQNEHEWVVVLKGAARLQFEGDDELLEMRPGDYVNIPAHKRHRVEWTTPEEPTVWLAVHYG